VKAAAGELGRLGGEVDLRFYPGMGHMVCADELNAVRRLMTALTMKEELTAWQ
jgi:predicted esterase